MRTHSVRRVMRTSVCLLSAALGVAACSETSNDSPKTEEKSQKSAEEAKKPPAASKNHAETPTAENDGRFAAPADVAAPGEGAEKTASGLAYAVLSKGKGKLKPGAQDTVTVHYTGWTTDGKMFDSSMKRGRPASFPLNGVIAGWTEGLQLMSVGDKFRFWIPEELAYQGRPGRPAGMLVFDVELLEVAKAPETPEDVAAPPKTATKTKSGLAYRVLEEGTGKEHPTATSKVTVHYSGWTTDGKMFDSSRQRGQPATFPLNRVIKGWTEGLQLMTEGARYRFWIPGDLAYGNQPGRPNGMLVFDVELLSIAAPPEKTPSK